MKRYKMQKKSNSCVIIAIAGASASGKSLLAQTVYEELKQELNVDKVDIISEDSYYKDQSHLSMEERIKTNYDHPQSMDHSLLVAHLKDLREGKTIKVPQYDYIKHTRKKECVEFQAKSIVILEGILLLTDEQIRKEVDMSIFVDAPLDICFIRRLKRDMEERGRSLDNIITQYKQTVRPMFLQFIEPSKQYADIIVPRGGKNRVAINILKAQILQLLS